MNKAPIALALPLESGDHTARYAAAGDPDAGGSSEKLFAIVHGRKACLRERISTFEFFFDQQFLVRQELQCRLVLLKIGTAETQHLAWSY